MAINFPSSPTLNQTFQVDGNSFIWNGTGWVGYTTSISLTGSLTASRFVRENGTSSQFLKANGDVDNSSYISNITIGTVTTGDAGTQASVTNTGTAPDAILNFTIPRGDTGAPGGGGGGGIGAESDTLDSVTDRGSTTTNSIGVSTVTLSRNLVFSNPNSGFTTSTRPLENSGAIVWSTTNTDYAWIRFNSTEDSNPPSQLEIAIGDNGNSANAADSIVVNQYAYYTPGETGPQPWRTLQLLSNRGDTTIPRRLGIGNTLPEHPLTVNFEDNTFCVTSSGSIGIGKTDPLPNFFDIDITTKSATGEGIYLERIVNMPQGRTYGVTVADALGGFANIGVMNPNLVNVTRPVGYIELTPSSVDSNSRTLWVDNSGNLRIVQDRNLAGSTNGAVVGDQTSDERLKTIVGSIEYGLETVRQLNPVKYTFKSDPTVEKIGFIAQQVRDIIPESVYDTKEVIEGYEDGETKLAMEYVSIIPALVNAIKELDIENQQLKARLNSIENKLNLG